MNYVEVDFYGALSLTDVISRLEEAYERLRSPLRRFAIAAINTLRPKLRVGADSLFSDRTLRRFNLTKGGARHAREKLVRMGHPHSLGGRLQPVDPLLSEWIVRLERLGGDRVR